MKMKLELTPKFIETLKNAASINNNIVLTGGNVIQTISPSTRTFARFILDVNVPKRVALYDLSKLLSVISLYKDDIECYFEDNRIKIIGNKKYEISILYTDERFIKNSAAAADKGSSDIDAIFSPENTVVSTIITKEILDNVSKVSSILGLPEIKIMSVDGKLSIVLEDAKKQDSSNKMVYTIDTKSDIGKKVYSFDVESFKMISDTYELTLAYPTMLAKFKSADKEYVIATNSNSKK